MKMLKKCCSLCNKALLASLLSAGLVNSATACKIPPGWTEMDGAAGEVGTVAINLGELPLAISEPFDAEIMTCNLGLHAVDRITIDAVMPMHNHGMNYYPEIKHKDGQVFGVTGMFFHMPGNWRILVGAHSSDKSTHFTLDVEAK